MRLLILVFISICLSGISIWMPNNHLKLKDVQNWTCGLQLPLNLIYLQPFQSQSMATPSLHVLSQKLWSHSWLLIHLLLKSCWLYLQNLSIIFPRTFTTIILVLSSCSRLNYGPQRHVQILTFGASEYVLVWKEGFFVGVIKNLKMRSSWVWGGL